MAKETTTDKDLSFEERQLRIQERQLAIQEAQIEEMRVSNKIATKQEEQTRSKNNGRPPLVSAFNPRGDKDYPMPELKFDVMAPWPLTKGKYHPLTDEEVRLMNRLIVPFDFTLELLDGSTVRGTIIAQKHAVSGVVEKIAFMGPRDTASGHYSSLYTKELKPSIPSLVSVLHQILDQQGVDYSDVLSMKEIARRIALPEAHADHLAVSVGQV